MVASEALSAIDFFNPTKGPNCPFGIAQFEHRLAFLLKHLMIFVVGIVIHHSHCFDPLETTLLIAKIGEIDDKPR